MEWGGGGVACCERREKVIIEKKLKRLMWTMNLHITSPQASKMSIMNILKPRNILNECGDCEIVI